MSVSEQDRAGGPVAKVTVAEVMHAGLIEVGPEASLTEIAACMADGRIHCVVVNQLARGAERGATWGVVSDLDLMRAISSGPPDALANSIAATDAPVVAPGEDVIRAAQLMAEHEVAHLLVALDEQPLGVISSLDVARALAAGAAPR